MRADAPADAGVKLLSVGAPAIKKATYQDLLNVPANLVAELIHGVLHTLPRPRMVHSRAASRLGVVIGGPFDIGTGGPGGWLIIDEPELHLGEEVLVPDLAGWRRTRMPELPDTASTNVAPNWACEVLSPSTTAIDRTEKVPIYAEHGVAHVWLIEPSLTTLEVFRLDGPTYRLVGTWTGSARVRAEPFDEVELDLGMLWAR